jgi:hypothetical protein
MYWLVGHFTQSACQSVKNTRECRLELLVSDLYALFQGGGRIDSRKCSQYSSAGFICVWGEYECPFETEPLYFGRAQRCESVPVPVQYRSRDGAYVPSYGPTAASVADTSYARPRASVVYTCRYSYMYFPGDDGIPIFYLKWYLSRREFMKSPVCIRTKRKKESRSLL